MTTSYVKCDDDNHHIFLECEPFIPEKENKCVWHEAAEAEGKDIRNFRIRVIRAFCIVTIPIVLLIWASFKSVSVSFFIGIGILFMFAVYFVIVLCLVFLFGDQNAGLFRIYSLSKQPHNWTANLNIGYIQLLYTKHSIKSISELSAIHGGVTKVMLNTLGAYTWVSIILHYAQELKWQKDFEWDASDILMIIGCMGLLWISIFELDAFNKNMQRMHYFGALCGTGTVVGFNLQQYSLHPHTYFYFSISLSVVCFLAFAAWQIACAATDLTQLSAEYYQQEEKYKRIFTPLAKWLITNHWEIKVNTYSRLNIGFEALFLFLGALSLCLFLMNYDNACKYGCSTIG